MKDIESSRMVKDVLTDSSKSREAIRLVYRQYKASHITHLNSDDRIKFDLNLKETVASILWLSPVGFP